MVIQPAIYSSFSYFSLLFPSRFTCPTPRLFHLREVLQEAVQHRRGLFVGLLRGRVRLLVGELHAGPRVTKEVLRHDGVQREGPVPLASC